VKAAYVDTSVLVAIVFGERGSTALRRRLESFDEVFSSNLLDAELKATLARERVSGNLALLDRICWVLPDHPLSNEFDRALAAGYLRGADLWHLACALYLSPEPNEIEFVTVDSRQRGIASRLGFVV
jgi:predicted nucleic acid-binding protein